jgi:hypothetical protein
VKGVDFLRSKSEFLDTIKLNEIKENPEVARLRRSCQNGLKEHFKRKNLPSLQTIHMKRSIFTYSGGNFSRGD